MMNNLNQVDYNYVQIFIILLPLIHLFFLDTTVTKATDATNKRSSSFKVNRISPCEILSFIRSFNTSAESSNIVDESKKKMWKNKDLN